MTGEVTAEGTGETVGEAKWRALRDLERRAPGFDKGAVRFQVLSEGERGLLGVGSTPARVLAVAHAAAAAQHEAREGETEIGLRVRQLVERVVGALGLRARIEVRESADELLAVVEGDDLGLLIGRHGQTIDALQYVANAILRRSDEDKPVTVDASGYRERRRAVLDDLAVRSAERVLETGERVALEPMAPIERKLVHQRLQDVAGVATLSEGAEPNRYVVVLRGRPIRA